MNINPNSLVNSQELAGLQARGITVKADAQQKMGIIEVNGKAFSVKLASIQSDHPLDEAALTQLAAKVAYMLLMKDFFKDEFSGAQINREGIKDLRDHKIVPHHEEGKADTSGHYQAIQNFIGQRLLGKEEEEKPPPLPPREDEHSVQEEEKPLSGEQPVPLPPRRELDTSKDEVSPEAAIESGEKAQVKESVEKNTFAVENEPPIQPPEEGVKETETPQTGLSSTLAQIRQGNFKLKDAKKRELAPHTKPPSSETLTIGDILIKAISNVPNQEDTEDRAEVDEFEDQPSPPINKEEPESVYLKNVEESDHSGKKEDPLEEGRKAQIDQEAEKKKEISEATRKQEEIKKETNEKETKQEHEESIQKLQQKLANALFNRRQAIADPDDLSEEEEDISDF
ncbi:hypothetical protein [Candidatus Protochlamydia phocaeensis]|uniref:hypothetical protein n=1 Tax=Candidatus Protochlamydia phocaeensis TaxID=1414722 RepID=UPI0008383658|nr:hypothetical protein [Candidatus Protochlamydia phocaeensis]